LRTSIRSAAFTAAVVLVLLTAGGTAASPDPACTVPRLNLPSCASLIPSRLRAQVVDRGRALEVDALVSNSGNTTSSPTTFQVTFAGRAQPPQPLGAVAVRASLPVRQTLAIPADLRGTTQLVSLEVDPNHAVPEFEEADNTDVTKAFLPPLPDLRFRGVTLDVVDGGAAIAVAGVVENAGGVPSDVATTVEIAVAGVTAASKPVAALALAASVPVDATVPVPATARVGTVAVTLTVDPDDLVAEADEGNNRSANGRTVRPDLVLADVDRVRRGDSLVVTAEVRNVGNADAGASTVRASARGWTPVAEPLAALSSRTAKTVTLRLAVPRSAHGRTVRVDVSVDPLAGDPPGNNRRSLGIAIAESSADLRVSGLRLTPRDDELLVHGLVANVGEAAARNVRIVLAAPGWPRNRRTLSVVRTGRPVPVDFVLPIGKEQRGEDVLFRLTAAPAPGETSLADNEDSEQVAVPALEGGPWTLVGLVGGALLALSLGAGFVLRGRRLRVRARWQQEAEPERPETCRVPETHVLRGDCELKPAFRKIEHLELVTGEDERRKTVEGTIVERLNKAVWARRLRRRRRVAALVGPLGEELAAEIERWLADLRESEVAISAHVKGGKIECEFTRCECLRDGDTCRWEERQQWKGEHEHEHDEPVAVANLPFEPRQERVRQLSGALLALVDRVDVPRRLRAPEAPATLPRN
jgi:hypothetical protein